MIAIAVPIVNVQGHLISTLSIHAQPQRLSLQDAGAHLELLRAGTKDLAQMLV